jgi:NUDE protein, C-terminal conserved region
VVKSSLDDVQAKYDKATEEMAMLQAELASAETLRIENQRLKDELRELKEECVILKEKEEARTTNGPAVGHHETPPSPPNSEESRERTPNLENMSPVKGRSSMGVGGIGGTGTWRGVPRGVGKKLSITSDISFANEPRQLSSVKIMQDMVTRVKVRLP